MSIQPAKVADPMTWRGITEDSKNGLDVNNLFEALSYLELKDLARCCTLNKAWKALASSDIPWKALFRTLAIPEGMGAKKYIDTLKPINPVFSYNQVLEKINALYSRIQFGQKASFTCNFPLNPSCSMKTMLGHGNAPEIYQAAPNLEEICTFLTQLPDDDSYSTPSRWGNYERTRTDGSKVGIYIEHQLKLFDKSGAFGTNLFRAELAHQSRLLNSQIIPPKPRNYHMYVTVVVAIAVAVTGIALAMLLNKNNTEQQ